MSDTMQAPLLPPARHSRIPLWVRLVGVGAFTLLAILTVLVGAWFNSNLTGVNNNLTGVNRDQQHQIEQLSKNNDALRDQVNALGHTPVAPPAVAVTGEAGHPGRDGLNGTNGHDGTSVSSVICQPNGEWLISYNDQTTQEVAGPCIGQDGLNGATGQPGRDGVDGANGVAGEPPYSWTWVSTSGISRTCNRADPFDSAAPSYVCTVDPILTPTQ